MKVWSQASSIFKLGTIHRIIHNNPLAHWIYQGQVVYPALPEVTQAALGSGETIK